MKNAPSQTDPASSTKKMRVELCVFFIGIGAILGVIAYFSLTGIARSAPQLWGMSRHLAIGVPFAALAVFHIASGAFLALRGSKIFCIAGALATTAFALFFFTWIISTTGFSLTIINALVAAIPFLVWFRAGKFLSFVPENETIA